MNLSSLGDSVARGFTHVPALVEGVLRHPSADPKMTLLVLAIALLALVSVVVLVLMAMPRKTKRVRKIVRRWVPDAPSLLETRAFSSSESGDSPSREIEEGWEESEAPAEAPPASAGRRARVRRALGLASAAGIPLLIAAALASAYALTGTDTACITCHGDSPAVLAVHENDHAGTASCTSCHEQGTGADLVSAVTGRATMVSVRAGLVTTGTVDISPVSNAACLRCHDRVLTGVLESSRVNIAVSHAEPLKAGWDCGDCHGRTGHLGEVGRVPVSMDRCLTCHDGDTASVECSTCHTTDIAATGRDSLEKDAQRITGSGNYSYPPVVASDTDCTGCHQPELQCDPCHGTRLPHPESFIQGYHAKDAAFEKKETCYRCHDRRDCDSCHSPFNTGHASNWKTDHQRSPWDAGCGCHMRGTNEDTPICVFCHDNAPTQQVGR